MSESIKTFDSVKVIADGRVGIIRGGAIRNGLLKYHVRGIGWHGYFEKSELEKIKEGAK